MMTLIIMGYWYDFPSDWKVSTSEKNAESWLFAQGFTKDKETSSQDEVVRYSSKDRWAQLKLIEKV